MPVALPYDVRLRLLRVTDARTDEQFGINMVGYEQEDTSTPSAQCNNKYP